MKIIVHKTRRDTGGVPVSVTKHEVREYSGLGWRGPVAVVLGLGVVAGVALGVGLFVLLLLVLAGAGWLLGSLLRGPWWRFFSLSREGKAERDDTIDVDYEVISEGEDAGSDEEKGRGFRGDRR